jgi:hypothetical protein
MKAKRFVVTGELFREAFHLPQSATIVGARTTERVGDVELIVEDGSFGDVPHGDIIPLCVPTITTKPKPCGCVDFTWNWEP